MTLALKISTLQTIYHEIATTISHFKEKTQIDCVYGCGDCCNHFEPYISVLEATLIVEYLQEDSERMERFLQVRGSKTDILCPFYQVASPYHCGIYPIRPLICRLYAFSGKKVDQQIHYSPCPRIRDHYTTEVANARRLIAEGLTIPLYKEQYPYLCELDFVLATDLHPLTRSVEIAIEHWPAIVTGDYQQKTGQAKSTTSKRLRIPFSRYVRWYLDGEMPLQTTTPATPV